MVGILSIKVPTRFSSNVKQQHVLSDLRATVLHAVPLDVTNRSCVWHKCPH